MGCPRKAYLEDFLTFGICTHDPNSGVLTDADALPIFRLYEDEVAFPVLTGTLTKLDDDNTTGFYAESVECVRQNGFERGKTYTVYIEATVDGDKGGMCYGFNVAARWQNIIVQGIDTESGEFHNIIGRIRER